MWSVLCCPDNHKEFNLGGQPSILTNVDEKKVYTMEELTGFIVLLFPRTAIIVRDYVFNASDELNEKLGAKELLYFQASTGVIKDF